MVDVVCPDNIVFAEIGTNLHLDDLKGYLARESGHSRVPKPPDRMTGTIMGTRGK